MDVFRLPNAGSGPDPFDLGAAAAEHDAIVLLFQRDFFCTNCREQVQDVAERYDEFEELNALVVSVLPENRTRADNWQNQYNLPFPLVADVDKAVSDGFGQPVKYGILGNLHDVIGRMPLVVVLETRGDDMEVVFEYAGNSTFDRPSVDDILGVVRNEVR